MEVIVMSEKNAHLITNKEAIRNGMNLLRKQFILMNRDNSVFRALNYIEKSVYGRFLRNAERVTYRTKSINHFINNLKYMDYLFNNSIPQLYGLNEVQALIAIAYSEMSLYSNEFDPQLSMPGMCRKSKRVFLDNTRGKWIEFSRIDRDIIITALDQADFNDDTIYPDTLLARMIHDILAVCHYILCAEIDAQRDIQDLVDDTNLFYELHEKRCRVTFNEMLAKFWSKFSGNSFNTFRWSIEIDDEIRNKYSIFQNQIDKLYKNK